MAFKHPKCGGRHETVSEARVCEAGSVMSAPPKPVERHQCPVRPEFVGKSHVVYRDAAPTGPQMETIKKMQLQPNQVYWARQATRGEVGDFIEQLITDKNGEKQKERGRRVSDTSKIPLAMLQKMPDGYYAARPDASAAFTFFRVSRPTKGQYKGLIKIQTQHSENLKMMLTLSADDFLVFFDRRTEDNLLYAAVDPKGCQLAYGQALNHCCKCGKKLTDDRSRYFGIGPDCEQDHPEIIDEVTDIRGAYTGPGWQ